LSVLGREYDQVCGVAKALELIGERWTILLVRDAFLGLRRFEEFQAKNGIARNVLTDRLNGLVDAGIFERVLYHERPPRHEYRLTDKGRELGVALNALREWGERHLLDEPPVELRTRTGKKRVVARLVVEGTRTLQPSDVELVRR
jgi:DNA-binding HxlR family transcriptional regulator